MKWFFRLLACGILATTLTIIMLFIGIDDILAKILGLAIYFSLTILFLKE